ncbi:hypothetical protein BGZ91_009060 [Linnemannia elongata]|nr:hypothetical protein BGZ91_009060 [Linnemannia elongata]
MELIPSNTTQVTASELHPDDPIISDKLGRGQIEQPVLNALNEFGTKMELVEKDEEECQENIKKDEEEDQDGLKKEYIKTDNSVELLKRALRKGSMAVKQHRHMNAVIYALAILAVPHFQQKCIRSIVNVGRMNPAQTEELKKTAIAVDHIKTKESKGYVGAYITQTSNDTLYVESFTNPTVGYAIKIDFSKTPTGQWPHHYMLL